MMKQLSNEQRARLEQIAESEFHIRWQELGNAKNKEYDAWYKAQITKAENDPLVKKLAKAFNEFNKIENAVLKKGINVSLNIGSTKPTNVRLMENTMSNDYPGIREKRKAAGITQEQSNAYTRAKNETMAVIWSMEQSFDACLKLIKASVAKIK